MIFRLLKYVRGMIPLVILSLLVLLGAKVIDVVIPARLGDLMDSAIAGSPVMGGALLIAILVAAAYLLDSINVLVMNWVGQRAVYRLRVRLFAHIQRLHIAFFDKRRIGDLISRTISDVDRLQAGFSEGLITIVGNVLLIMAIVIAMFVVDWHIALIILCVFPLVIGVTWRFGHLQKKAFAAVRATLGRLNVFIQEHLVGSRVVRSFCLEPQETIIFAEHNEQYRKDNIRTIKAYSFFFAGIDWLQSLVLILTFVGLVLFGRGDFNPGTFFTFSLYLLTIFRPLRDTIERYNVLQEAFAAGQRVFALLDEMPMIRGQATASLSHIEQIAFEDVSFSYDGENPVLKEISFTLEGRENVALVGETGAGKTTIMSLLLRFYDVTSGRITINGIDIRDYPLEEVRRQFSVVLQDPVIFSGTTAENVSLFDESLPVKEALDYVGLDETTPVYSVGQKQLLSLARAVAHRRSVIMLDEATANIDTLTEQKIQETLAKLLHERASLIIAHRLSTIHAADKILVLHEGELVESGTHQELMGLKGYYEKLYRQKEPRL